MIPMYKTQMVQEKEIGIDTGVKEAFGFCTYPLYMLLYHEALRILVQ